MIAAGVGAILRVAAAALAFAFAACAPAAHAEDAPPDLGRWVMRCEAGVCRASLPSDSGEEALLVARWAGTDGFAIGFVTPRATADRERPIDLRVDASKLAVLQPSRDYQPFERPDAFWVVDAKPAAGLAQAALAGRHLRISYLDVIGAPHDADFAVDGLGKLLDFFDSRLGPVKRIGISPAKRLTQPPAVTRLELVTRLGIPDRLMLRHRAASDCEDPASPLLKSIPPLIGALSNTAFLYGIPCTSAAGNVAYRLWVVETGEIGGITPLYFALYDPGFGWKGSDLLYNVAFDGNGARLTSEWHAPGPSACPWRAAWHWKDYAFALDEFRLTADCPGRPHQGDASNRVYPAN
ncbi:MAG: DUF1176 domain-containing protein [Ancalomicrobiaceae bacterium]|nr:DUF1176 domain-containing protein [Ancalomicrobiaceae bacterium]